MGHVLSFQWPKLAALWFLLAGGVAAARTLVDCHFPSDVVVASSLGTMVGCFVIGRMQLPRAISAGLASRAMRLSLNKATRHHKS